MVVHCSARSDQRYQQTPYRGEPTCSAANLVAGVQGCTYGCLGLGDCVRVCDYDAIHIVDGLAVVDYDKNELADPIALSRCPPGAIVWVEGAQFQTPSKPLEKAVA